jgi:hypothetical protein
MTQIDHIVVKMPDDNWLSMLFKIIKTTQKLKKAEHMNPNHPKKGSSIKVEPIKKLKDIRSIKKLLADHPRNLCLFTIGINTNLRASDLFSLTVGQVRQLKAGDEMGSEGAQGRQAQTDHAK